MIADIKKTAEQKMAKTVETLKHDLQKVRTGRAHTGLLDHLRSGLERDGLLGHQRLHRGLELVDVRAGPKSGSRPRWSISVLSPSY